MAVVRKAEEKVNRSIIIAIFIFAFHASAASEKLIPLTKACIDEASDAYDIHPDILYAILLVEGGSVGKSNSGNSNRTYDYNLFQINSVNFPKYLAMGISKASLINDGCLNAFIASDHLVSSVKLYKPDSKLSVEENYLKSLASYHSLNEPHNSVYASKLYDAFVLMSQQ